MLRHETSFFGKKCAVDGEHDRERSGTPSNRLKLREDVALGRRNTRERDEDAPKEDSTGVLRCRKKRSFYSASFHYILPKMRWETDGSITAEGLCSSKLLAERESLEPSVTISATTFEACAIDLRPSPVGHCKQNCFAKATHSIFFVSIFSFQKGVYLLTKKGDCLSNWHQKIMNESRSTKKSRRAEASQRVFRCLKVLEVLERG